MKTKPVQRLVVLAQVEADGTIPSAALLKAKRVQKTLDRVVDTWFDEEALAVVNWNSEQLRQDVVFLILLVGFLAKITSLEHLLEVCDELDSCDASA